MSERAPQWERDNGLPGRHALSSPVPPRSCHGSLIAQNGLLRDCCLPLRRLLPFPFPRRPGARRPPPLRARRGGPGGRGRGGQPRPPSKPGPGRAKAFLRGRDGNGKSGKAAGAPAPGPGPSGAAAPARPHLQRRGAGASAPGQARLLPPCPGLNQPAGLGFPPRPPPRVTHIYRNGAGHRDGHTGAFGCDGISPEVRQGRSGGARP